jgi:hypothetical protein
MYALRELHHCGLLRQNLGYYAKYKEAFFKQNDYKVLFLGSSRAEMHYDIRLFDSLTGSNAFNLSLAGATPHVAFASLKAYLLNSKIPQEIFYEVDIHSLKWETKEIKEFNNYFPFFKNKVLLQEFNRIDSRMTHFSWNPYYSFPFTGLKNISTSLHGWMNIPNASDSLYYKGFVRETLRPALTLEKTVPVYNWFHPNERAYLDSIIFLCKQNQVVLHLITSPMFAGGKIDLINKSHITKNLQNIAKIHGIDYFDYSSTAYCHRRELFIDHFHMNARGADKFTRDLALFYNNNLIRRPLK